MRWSLRRPVLETQVQRAELGPSFSLGDPALAGYLGLGAYTDAGVNVTENGAIALTAVYRSVSLLAGTIASLPLKTYTTTGDSDRNVTSSFLDEPSTYMSAFNWKQTVVAHVVLHGNAYLLHVYNGAGSLAGLFPVHPSMVTPEWIVNNQGQIIGKQFKVQTQTGETVLTDDDMTQIMGLSLDGLCGLSVIGHMRNALGTSIAGDKAAGRLFASGMLIGGIVTSDDMLNEDDARTVLAGLKAKLTGSQNAGDIAIVNASLKFQPWTMNSADAQFIESRTFQVTEIARIFGVPVEMLAQTGATSWGTGIQELIKGFQRFTLVPITSAIEETLSTLLPNPRHVEFDFAGLLQGTPAEEIALLIQQVEGGLLTMDEARAIRNLPPLPKTDVPAPLVPPLIPVVPTGEGPKT